MKRSIVQLSSIAALALGASVALGLPAQAKAPVQGTCSGTSTTTFTAKVKKDMIVVKAKVDSDVAGETWTYTVADNGLGVIAGEATTNEDGKVKVKTAIPNLEGTDTVDFTAMDTVTGETCTAEVVLEG